MKKKAEGVRKIWDSWKYAILTALIGAGLLLLPAGRRAADGRDGASKAAAETAERDLQGALEEILGNISGVGQAKVLLTVESDGETQLAQNTELSYSGSTASPEDYSRKSTAVLVDAGSGGEEIVVVRRLQPTYRGALVVCQGGDRADVRLAVTEAVAAVTGLSTDRVTVAKWQ